MSIHPTPLQPHLPSPHLTREAHECQCTWHGLSGQQTRSMTLPVQPSSGKHYKDIWQQGPKPEFSACKLNSSIFQIHSYQDIPLKHGVFPFPIWSTKSIANTFTHCSSPQITTRGRVCTWADYKDTQKILGYAGFWLTVSHWEQVLLTCS